MSKFNNVVDLEVCYQSVSQYFALAVIVALQ